MIRIRLHLSAIMLAVTTVAFTGHAFAEDFVDTARQKVAVVTKSQDKWDGPTSGPKATAAKTIVFVAADLKNGGILGVSNGVEEAGKTMGWTVRVIDGQGTVSGRTAALNQALALKPAGIVVGGFDTTEQKVAFQSAATLGVPLVGWHSGEKPGPNDKAGLFANVTTVTDDVADAAASWVVADSNGKAGVVIFTDSQYAIALYKARAMEAVIKQCGGCTVLSFEDSPIGEFDPHAATDHLAAATLWRQVDALAGDQRPVLRFHGPVTERCGQEGRWQSQGRVGRRWVRGRLPAHSQQALPGRHGARATEHAGLADHR